MRIQLCLIALAASAAWACSPETKVAATAVDLVTIEHKASGPWRAAYSLAEPRAEIDLGPSVGGFRREHWRAEGTSAQLVERDGRDVIVGAGGRPFREAAFMVDPAAADFIKDYEPFMPMGDGGALFYTGHFLPFGDDGARTRTKLTVIADKGAAVSAFGETAPRFDGWESPFDHPAFIYVGAASPQETRALVTIADQTAPAWVREEVASFAPAIALALQTLLVRALPDKPNIFVAMSADRQEGKLGYSGDALPGQYQMTLAGGAWRKSSPEALKVLRRSTAHETAHLWQAAAKPKSDAVPDWIHEGGADALAAEALVAAGYWTEAERAADLDRAKAECARSLDGMSLHRAEAESRWKAVYACGHVLSVAAAGDGGVAAFWREFVRRAAAADGYDEALFFELAQEASGPAAVQAMRDLTRINDARPDFIIARMFGGTTDLAAGGGR